MGEKDEEQELLCPLLLHTINVERNYSWSGSRGGGGDGSHNVLLSEEDGLWARRMFTALLEEE